MQKIREYLEVGVLYVWIIDPLTRYGEVHTRAGVERIADGVFRAGVVEVNLFEMLKSTL